MSGRQLVDCPANVSGHPQHWTDSAQYRLCQQAQKGKAKSPKSVAPKKNARTFGRKPLAKVSPGGKIDRAYSDGPPSLNNYWAETTRTKPDEVSVVEPHAEGQNYGTAPKNGSYEPDLVDFSMRITGRGNDRQVEITWKDQPNNSAALKPGLRPRKVTLPWKGGSASYSVPRYENLKEGDSFESMTTPGDERKDVYRVHHVPIRISSYDGDTNFEVGYNGASFNQQGECTGSGS